MKYLITELDDVGVEKEKVLNERQLWRYIQDHENNRYYVEEIGERILDFSERTMPTAKPE